MCLVYPVPSASCQALRVPVTGTAGRFGPDALPELLECL